MKKLLFSLMAAVLVLAVFAPAVFANPEVPPDVNQELAAVRRATVKYHDYRAAEADGFFNTGECVEVPGLGAMGVHFVHFGRLMDPTLSATEPEILMYQPLADGGYRLIGVEYMYPIADLNNPPPQPSLFGVGFDGPMAGHAPGEPPHYDLHAWVWQGNAAGTFAQFNDGVSCQ